MSYVSLFLVISSALLHALAFVCPKYFFWCVFISLIPFGSKTLFNKKLNFLWGLLFNSVFLMGLLPFLHTFAHGPLKFVPYGILVLYFSAVSWAFSPTSPIYHIFLYYGALLPLGQFHGVPLMNILVPLAEYSQLIIATRYIGVMGLTMILLLFQYFLARKSWWAVVCLAPFMLGFFVRDSQPDCFAQVAYLTPTPGEQPYVCDVAQDVADRITKLKKTSNPQLILLPEGSFKCPLHTVLTAQEIITQAAGETEIVLGSHRKEGELFYNCAYHVKQGKFSPIYDKQLCVPFAEYVPVPWRWSSWLANLFLQGHEQLCPGADACRAIALPIGPVTPQICYDLYFRPTEPNGGQTNILLLTNDRWYPSYMQHLLWLLARLRAVAWGREIWYIAHTGGWWLGKWGGTVILRTV